MWDEDGPHHMSEVFRGWLGGQLAGTRELAWCFAPFVNSYKRYQPDSWAPTAIGWGKDNRTLGLRVVSHGPGYRVESRIPGADANPYLAIAAKVAAGLHGIEHGLEPGEPYEGNGYTAEDLPAGPPHPGRRHRAAGGLHHRPGGLRRGGPRATWSTPPCRSGTSSTRPSPTGRSGGASSGSERQPQPGGTATRSGVRASASLPSSTNTVYQDHAGSAAQARPKLATGR